MITVPPFSGMIGPSAAGGGGGIPVSGLQYRFVGDDLVGADGAAQSSWPAGAGTVITCSQATEALQPIKKTAIINGHDVARCAANKMMLFDSIPALTNTLSFFAVFTYAGSGGSFMGTGGENQCPQVRIQSNKIELLASGAAVLGASSTTLSTGTAYTIGVLFDNSLSSDRVKFYLNGVADGTGNNSTPMTGRTGRILSSSDGERFNGDLAEMFNYDRVVSGSELTEIFDALRALYGTW